jgi:putative PIN family toxin of toxin-antitoxin system
MSEELPRVVLDTVVFVQSIISGRRPSAACVEELRAGRFVLLMSDDTLAELTDVPVRPSLLKKYPFVTAEAVAAFVAEIASLAVRIPKPPNVFTNSRDPKDEPFVDLAVAGGAQFIVTWNERHLTYLMKRDTPEGNDFCERYPKMRIVSPPDFLVALRR